MADEQTRPPIQQEVADSGEVFVAGAIETRCAMGMSWRFIIATQWKNLANNPN